MIHPRSIRCTAAAALALAIAGTIPASAETARIKYSVRLIGLSLGQAALSGTFDPQKYQVEVNARLSGIAVMVSNSKGAATATGGIDKNKPSAATYATTSSNSKETRTVRMAMQAGTVKGLDSTPPFEDHPARVPLLDQHKRSIVDPVSALVMPVAGTEPLVGPAACNRTIPIFDGYTRFDVTLSFVGVREVKTKGYSGPVAVCAARYTPVAGHRTDRKANEFMANNKQMEAWLMPLENARVLLPYRISVATMVGTTVIEAQEIAIEGATKAAQR